MPGFRWQISQTSGAIPQQKIRNHFENAGTVAPTAHVNVFDVAEFADEFRLHAGLFPNLAHRGLFGALARIDDAFGQRQHYLPAAIQPGLGTLAFGRASPSRLDGDHPPQPATAADYDTSGGKFTGTFRCRLAGHGAPKGRWVACRRLPMPY